LERFPDNVGEASNYSGASSTPHSGEGKLMSHKSKNGQNPTKDSIPKKGGNPPHVVNPEQGAHDIPVPTVVREGDGFHSGRPTPKPTPHRDLDR